MDIPAEKRCPQCETPKPATTEFFYRDKSRKDGLTALCKVHKDAVHKNFAQNNREATRRISKDSQLRHIDEIRARRKETYWNNPDKARIDNQKNYQKHRDKRLAWQKAYYLTHAIFVNLYQKQYRKTHADILSKKAHERWLRLPKEKKIFRFKEWERRNPEKAKAIRYQWRKDHPEFSRRWNQMRRARRLLAMIIDEVDLEYIAERDNWRCHICHKKVTRKTWSIDHHFPLSKPGAIHGRQYVSLAHRRCNSARGNGRPGYPAQLRLLP